MSALARLAARKPKHVLGVWLACVGVLGLVGLRIEGELHRSDLILAGSSADRARSEFIRPRFGENYDTIVLLEGPRAALDAQTRTLASRLGQIPDTMVLAPGVGGGAALRPGAGKALLIVRAQGDFQHSSKEVVPRVRAAARELVHAPVESHVSGYSDIANGIHGGTVDSIKRAELIATPLLLLILLVVFRSPVAAALPLFVGLTTIGAARGVLALVNHVTPLDALALNIASMMGLALGVDYALLTVSRYREETKMGSPPGEAALVAGQAAGRTIVAAGAALVIAMAASLLVVPGGFLAGIGVGLLTSVLLSVLGALTALPAALTLLGTKVDRWSFGGHRAGGARLGALALAALRRPAVAAGLVLLLVLGLSAPTLGLRTGPPDPRALPASSKERKDYEAVRASLGGGWIAPYEIDVKSTHGPLTSRGRLEAIDRFQRRLAARRDVAAVLGPGQIAQRTRPLARVPAQIKSAGGFLREGISNQARLENGLGRAGRGVDQLQGGLVQAADGAGRLQAGGDQALGGADALRAGLADATTGADQLAAGLGQARSAVVKLAAGSSQALAGAQKIGAGLKQARTELDAGLPGIVRLRDGLSTGAGQLERLRQPAQIAQGNLENGLKALDAMLPSSKVDPHYRDAYEAVATALGAVSGRNPTTGEKVDPSYDGLDASLAQASAELRTAAAGVDTALAKSRELSDGLRRLNAGARQLESGLTRLESGTRRLKAGMDRLVTGGGTLASGVDRLSVGSGRLAAGVGQLAGGAGQLHAGLSSGAGRISELRSGIERMHSGVVMFQRKSDGLRGSFRQTSRLTPTLRSPYFTLAAVDGAPRAQRVGASFALNVDSGGNAARIVVVGYGNAQLAGHPLRAVLDRELGPLARAVGGDAVLSGTATTLQDFDAATHNRLPLLALALSVVTYLVLVVVLRSLLLPLLAVVFNVLTATAAFGVLILLFQGDHPLLGGPGFVDAITVFGVFTILFGLSIDYEVFLLTRMREGYAVTGSTDGAIAYGIERTAGVVTGAALAMTAVFAASASADIMPTKEFGVGLGFAVLFDATLVRLVLLPGAMRLCGEANWWLPGPLAAVLGPSRAERVAARSVAAQRSLAIDADYEHSRNNRPRSEVGTRRSV